MQDRSSPKKDSTGNLVISKDDLDFIRKLEDFDLIMLLSETHDHGWQDAMLRTMRESIAQCGPAS
jgi:hypothetical protein